MRYLKFALLLFLSFFMGCNQNNDASSENNVAKEENTTLFSIIAPEKSGIHFTNKVVQTTKFNYTNYEYIYTGAGIAVIDVNNDGLQDLYFVSNFESNKLFLNNGDLSFREITKSSGTGLKEGFATGVTVLDINNDGWQDLYVCRAGSLENDEARRNVLYVNQKDGTFAEQAKEWGLDYEGYSTQAYPLDYDKDGDLDLYIVNHRNDFSNVRTISTALQRETDYLTSDQLFRNDETVFSNQTATAGLENKTWGLSAVVSDFNEDSNPDIYVCNDFLEPDFYYINQPDHSFKNFANNSFKHISYSSMGSDYADLNNDLAPELMTVDMMSDNYARSKENMASMSIENFRFLVDVGYHHQYSANMLHLNKGYGFFTEVGQFSGVDKTDWSWAVLMTDFDNDGLKDIYVTNGVEREYNNQDARKKIKEISEKKEAVVLEDILNMYPSEPIANHIYRNKGDLQFEKAMNTWGLNEKTYSYGAVYVDLDNDGDLEIVTNNLNAPAGIYNNQSTNNFLQIKLIGDNKNPLALHAKVYVTDAEKTQVLEAYQTRGYESSVTNILNFGLGKLEEIQEVNVVWPDGKITKLTNPKPNQLITVNHKDALSGSFDYPRTQYRKKSSSNQKLRLSYEHKENNFDDYKKQLLLPQKQSSKGASLAKADVNGDGLEDFFVGNAMGSPASLYIQNADGTFSFSNATLWKQEAKYEDANALFFDADKDGDSDLYVVSSGYELADGDDLLKDRLYLNDGKGIFKKSETALPNVISSGKALTAADFDGDGDLDLFIGGNTMPLKYPLASPSYLLRNDNGVFKDITKDNPDLQQPGIISDAIFSDFDNDSDQDLLLVGEWMAPTFYKNNNGNFSKLEIKEFEDLRGWWFSALATDIDNDGDMDYFFGNLGENNKFHPSKEKPLYIYAKDFDTNGSLDVALSKINNGRVVPVRGKECSSEQNPFLLEKIKTYKEFANLDMEGIYGKEELSEADRFIVHTFKSYYAINQGNGSFKLQELPLMAQTGPTLAFEMADVNADGYNDIIGVGAIYDAEVETIRYDSNFGYTLLNNGKGEYTYAKEYDPFVTRDAKDILQISINDEPHYIVVSNNAPLEVFTFQP